MDTGAGTGWGVFGGPETLERTPRGKRWLLNVRLGGREEASDLGKSQTKEIQARD